MKRFAIVLALFVALLVAGCDFRFNVVTGSGKVITESRAVSNFNGLTIGGAGEFTITQDGTEALILQAEDNIAPLITTQVQNGTLVISFARGQAVNPTMPIKFDLHVKNLDAINVNGAAQIIAASLKSDHLSLIINGAGNVRIDDLEGTEVNVSINGAGNVDMSGNMTTQSVNLNGLGSYRAANLQSEKGSVSVSGAGSATVWTSTRLDVTISGAGSVNYFGSPQVSQRIAGAGSVKSLGNK